MKVFVSWSGKKSRDVAKVFGEWLPSVLHAVTPFVSARDIQAGTRWQGEIAAELNETDFGLICVTGHNRAAEWLNFEAGALAKSVDSSRVVPLAIDVAPADIANPLGQFQAIRLTKEDISSLLTSMNEACQEPISEERLAKALDKWWPDLEAELRKIEEREYEESGTEPAPMRSDRDLLEEVLASVRTLGRRPLAPKRSGPDRATEMLREELMKNNDHYGEWRIESVSPTRRIVKVARAPESELFDLSRELEEQFGVEIEFEPIPLEEEPPF